MEFLSYLISGISLGSVYAIIALGYTMVYGIAKMLNFAHGDVIMIGGNVAFCAMFYLGLPSIVAVLMAVVVCTVLGIVIERLAYKPLRSAPSLAVLITAIGVSYFLQNLALLLFDRKDYDRAAAYMGSASDDAAFEFNFYFDSRIAAGVEYLASVDVYNFHNRKI